MAGAAEATCRIRSWGMSSRRRHRSSRSVRAAALVLLLASAMSGCGVDDDADATGAVATTTGASPSPSDAAADAEELYPDVVGATATRDGDGTWTFEVTMSSPYDSPQRYADAWRVLGPDGDVYGERLLTHDHASEQPFTRSQSGIEIPSEVATVTVQGRDQVSGWGGATVQVTLTG